MKVVQIGFLLSWAATSSLEQCFTQCFQYQTEPGARAGQSQRRGLGNARTLHVVSRPWRFQIITHKINGNKNLLIVKITIVFDNEHFEDHCTSKCGYGKICVSFYPQNLESEKHVCQ